MYSRISAESFANYKAPLRRLTGWKITSTCYFVYPHPCPLPKQSRLSNKTRHVGFISTAYCIAPLHGSRDTPPSASVHPRQSMSPGTLLTKQSTIEKSVTKKN